MSSNNIAIKVESLSKSYQIYERPQDRLKQSILPRLYRFFGKQQKQYFGEFKALDDISFDINVGETVGIIGRNGSGKSTLLQLICGTLNPTTGNIKVQGRIAALLELGSGFNPEFTGRENVYLNASVLGLTRQEIDLAYQDIVSFADIGMFIDQPVKTYSSGMVVRLAFSVIVHVKADILVIDEALAVGDAVFTQKCMRFLRRFMESGTILFVSHDIGAISGLCNRAIWLDGGRVELFDDVSLVANAYTKYCLGGTAAGSIALAVDRQVEAELLEEAGRTQPIDTNTKVSFYSNIENSDGWKTGNAEIVAVKFETPESKNIISGGELVTIKIKAVTHCELKNPIIGFLIKDRLGQALFGENTFKYGGDLPVNILPNEFLEAEFKFNFPLLPNGKYSMTVSIAEGTLEEHVQHHWLHDAVIIQIQSDQIRYGLIAIPFESVKIKRV